MNDVDAEAECDPVRLPGAAASTLKVPSFLNSLPRLLLKTKSGFQGFLQSIVRNPSLEVQATSTRSSATWPMPLPYPEVFTSGSHLIPSCHLKRLVCLQIAAFNWLCLNCPSHCPFELKLGRKLAGHQWSVVRMLEHLVVDGNTPEFIEAGDMGRTASKVEDLEEHLSVLSRAFSEMHDFCGGYDSTSMTKPDLDNSVGPKFRCGPVVGRSTKEAVITAKPLVASRLKFPSAPSFNPLPFFDADTELRYTKPRSAGRLPEEVEGIPPRVNIRADPENKKDLLRMLALSGRLQPIEADSYFSSYASGMFAVGKDQLRDRLILDGRPANMLDLGQSKWCKGMASASAVSQLFLEEDRDLCICGEDLHDYFYQFSVNAERVRRNALCESLSVSDASYVFGKPMDEHASNGRVHVGFSSLAMGDVCAVEYAQCAHLSILLQNDVVRPVELLTLHGSIPRGLLQIGVIVDDLIILQQILKSQWHVEGKFECEKRVDKAKAAYNKVGLESNPKQAINRATSARFWGIEIDGVKGLCRCSSLRLWPVIAITLRVTRLGLATIGLLECLAGSWVSLLGVRRRLYSLLDIIFDALTVEDQKQVVRLSDALTSELQLLCVLGPLAVVNLRAKAAPFVAATDASLEGMAAVRAQCPRAVSEELFRHVIRKGVWAKLLGPRDSWDRIHGLLSDGEDLTQRSIIRAIPCGK